MFLLPCCSVGAEQSFSKGARLPPRGHVALSGDICCCQCRGRELLARSGQRPGVLHGDLQGKGGSHPQPRSIQSRILIVPRPRNQDFEPSHLDSSHQPSSMWVPCDEQYRSSRLKTGCRSLTPEDLTYFGLKNVREMLIGTTVTREALQ